ncbi:Hypothetical protein I595_518 [Croceitalea dokdonensis DOKDO 023]|uniref:Uncharacterized protein n=1 Tax=Croceitalea dokdonensis DOKDO 023 TaxID=1300341 RepID=A0A0P7AJ31_9FLAO|nr:Hypothetical protein I595_518 [Croceitalea dokdonensis DOKDO 023]
MTPMKQITPPLFLNIEIKWANHQGDFSMVLIFNREGRRFNYLSPCLGK